MKYLAFGWALAWAIKGISSANIRQFITVLFASERGIHCTRKYLALYAAVLLARAVKAVSWFMD